MSIKKRNWPQPTIYYPNVSLPITLVDPNVLPEVGDIMLSYSAGAPTKIITWFTDSPFTHCELLYGSPHGDPKTIAAGPVFWNILSKVRIIPMRTMLDTHVAIWRHRDMNTEDRLHAVEWADNEDGAPYAYLEYITYAYRKVFDKLLSYESDKNVGFVCSEFITYAYQEAMKKKGMSKEEYERPFGFSPPNTAPGDIAKSSKCFKIAEYIPPTVQS